MSSLSDSSRSGRSNFHQVIASFLSQPGLPFANILSAERIERIFTKHGNLFGKGQIYSTVVMVWSFLGQVLRDGKEASCQAAVARVVAYQEQHDALAPTSDTGDYCRARNKLSEAALRDVSVEVAAEMQEQAPDEWLWKGRHAKLVDGFTFTMPDTPENQRAYPRRNPRSPAWVCRSLGRWRSSRWPRRVRWTWPLVPTRARRPARRRCCGSCSARSVRATWR